MLFRWSTVGINSVWLRKQPFSTWNYAARCLCSKIAATIPDKCLGIPCSICQGIYQFVPFPPIQCCLFRWSCDCSFTTLLGVGGRGLPILMMPLGIIPKCRVSVFSWNLCQVCQGLLSWIVVHTVTILFPGSLLFMKSFWPVTLCSLKTLGTRLIPTAFALPGILIREWIRHECPFFSTRDVNSVKIARSRLKSQPASPALLFKHYIFISEDLRWAETLIFLITKVNSISLFMCFVSQSSRSAATVCLCLQTGTFHFGLSPHAILAALFQEKNWIKFGHSCVCRQKNFFVRAQLYGKGFNVNARVKLIQLCMKKENSSDHLAQNIFKLDREDSVSL